MRKLIKLNPLIIIILSLIISGCNNSNLANPIKQSEFIMGTYVTITIYDSDHEQTLTDAFEKISQLEKVFSTSIADSELNRLNEKAGQGPVPVSDELWEILQISDEFARLSDGAFDYTIGPLTSLWHIGYDDARKPSPEEIEAVLPLIDYQAVRFDPSKQTVELPQAGMAIDLGAVAKGYIEQKVFDLLKEAGVTTAILDLGGNIYVMGDSPKRQTGDWKVGVQDVYQPKGEVLGSIYAKNQAIVTSGIYERFLEVDGVHYHHILDTQTGYPIDNGIVGVTVLSNTIFDADALSTTLFSFGMEQGLAYIEKTPGIEGIFIMSDQTIHLSSGLKDNFILSNDTFKIVN